MSSADIILNNAAKRKRDMDLPYAGSLTPPEAYQLLCANNSAVLVDVRTAPEIAYVGFAPDSIHLEWQVYPDMSINPHFCDALAQQAERDNPVLFLCRSGVRSHHAATAATAAGFANAYNILEGFEGDPDDNRQRGKVNGWRFHQLPWTQT